MDLDERQRLLAQYRSGAEAVQSALAGLTDEDLDFSPTDGGWTARQIAHHVADSEATSYVRLRRLIAEDQPEIAAYDEEGFAKALHYDRPIEPSLAVVRAVREASIQLLESLSEDEWLRTGTHSTDGAYSVHQWLRTYAEHPHDHAEQIRRAFNSQP